MGAPTETYIDPSIAGDSGAGTIGDPYGDVQYALNQVTRDATNGDRFNIKSGTDEVLGAALDFSTYGTPTSDAPWICQGYTSSAGDGGIGGVSGNGSYSVITGDALDYLIFIDMHLHNSGANDVISADNWNSFVNCEVDNTSGNGLDLDVNNTVINCHIHNCGGVGVTLGNMSIIAFCTLEDAANVSTSAITLAGWGATALGNIIDKGSTGHGINSSSYQTRILNNSIYANGSTGSGITSGGSGTAHGFVLSNIIEGFSGVGGDGIDLSSAVDVLMLGYNAYYNNTTNLSKPAGEVRIDLSANDQALGSSAFADAANDDFRVKPSVQGLGYPIGDYPDLSVRSYLDIGALQRMSQMLVHPGMAGGARG